jgi:hypothetical protein
MIKKMSAMFLLVAISVLFCDIQSAQHNIDITEESVLLLVHDCLEKAIQACGLGERLELASVFAACKTLHTLRKSAVGLYLKNETIPCNIIQNINEYLMQNPALLTFLKNFNMSLIARHQLTEREIAAVLKNGALLIPINEIYALAEIIKIVQGIDKLVLSPKRLDWLLKAVDLDQNACVFTLWQRKQDLRKNYEFWQRKESELSEKIKCTKQMYRMEKNMTAIFAALGITEQYAEFLKPFDVGGMSHKKMDDLFEDAFDENTWNIKTYALSVERNIREECR